MRAPWQVADVIEVLQKKQNICMDRCALFSRFMWTERKDMHLDVDFMMLVLALTDWKERESGFKFNRTVKSDGRLENV